MCDPVFPGGDTRRPPPPALWTTALETHGRCGTVGVTTGFLKDFFFIIHLS